MNSLSLMLKHPLLSAALAIFPLASLFGQEMRMRPEESMVRWKASKVTGAHDGRVSIKHGVVVWNNGILAQADVTIDMTTIVCDDIQNPSSNTRLVNHLKSADFFHVENHGEASFRTRSVEKVSGAADKFRITGDLVIKGISMPNTFEVTAEKTGDSLRVEGTMVFDRSKYDVRYGSGSFFSDLGDRTIHDAVTMSWEVLAR